MEQGAADRGTPHRRRRPTSTDVAREAGLSRATVSYVLNATPDRSIPEPTRQRVFDAAARLGYAPSAAARALRSGRSDVVLCLLPDWPIGPTVGAILERLSAALAAADLTFLTHLRGDRAIADVWKAITPAAVLTFEKLSRADTASIHAAGIELTVVLFGGPGRRHGILDIPEQRTGRLQVQHLAVTGHRRLGYAFPDDARLLPFAEPRLDGARQECAELGLEAPHVQIVPLTPEGGRHAVQKWRDTAVTAVCAYNDDTALAVLAGMRQLNLFAPNDLAIVGVDDIPAAATAVPPLTTITIDTAAIADQITQHITTGLAGTPRPASPGSGIFHITRRDTA